MAKKITKWEPEDFVGDDNIGLFQNVAIGLPTMQNGVEIGRRIFHVIFCSDIQRGDLVLDQFAGRYNAC